VVQNRNASVNCNRARVLSRSNITRRERTPRDVAGPFDPSCPGYSSERCSCIDPMQVRQRMDRTACFAPWRPERERSCPFAMRQTCKWLRGTLLYQRSYVTLKRCAVLPPNMFEPQRQASISTRVTLAVILSGSFAPNARPRPILGTVQHTIPRPSSA